MYNFFLTTDDRLEKMAKKLQLGVKVKSPLVFLEEVTQMVDLNLNNPMEILNRRFQTLNNSLEPVDMDRFLQPYDSGYGDYTKEKQKEAGPSLDELDRLLKMK